MKQINVIRNGQITNSLPYSSPADEAHFANHEAMGTFGANVSSYEQLVSEEIAAIYEDQNGEQVEIQAAIPAVYETIQVPADYTVEITDITDSLAQQATNTAAKAYLAATDYIVIRAAERGEELSIEFKAERQAARDSIVE